MHDVAVNDLAVAMAFVEGFKYALGPGGQQLKDSLMHDATKDAMDRLEPVIKQRLDEAGNGHLKDNVSIQSKIRECQDALKNAKSPADKEKHKNYVEALRWATNGN